MKTEFTRVLANLVVEGELGWYFSDGAFVSNVEADVSNQPDGMFVSMATLDAGLVRIVEGRAEGHVEVEGSPDMALEVTSRSSIDKDTEVLREAYAAGGIREYWLIDARNDPLRFDLLRLDRGSYRAVRKRGGWARSEVFGRWFRLVQRPPVRGYPAFRLEMREEKP